MSGLWRKLRHRLEYGLLRLARLLDRALGTRLSSAMAGGLGRFTYRRLRIRASVVEDQLRAAFPEKSEAWVRATASEAYAHLGREAVMLIRLSRLGPEAVIEATDVVGDFDALRQAIEDGRGAVMVSGHMGNWELSGAAIAARGIPMVAVARKQANPLVDDLVNASRERLGMRVVEMDRATKESLRALREGQAVGLVADQDARQRGVFVPFFGRLASTFRGPAALAQRSGAPVFLVTSARKPDGRYVVRIRQVPLPEAGDPERQAWELTARLAAGLEAAVRKEPSQYLWHHRRWKTRPSEAEAEAVRQRLEEGNGAQGSPV